MVAARMTPSKPNWFSTPVGSGMNGCQFAGVDEERADHDEQHDHRDLDRDDDVVDGRGLGHADHQQHRDRQRDEHRRQVEQRGDHERAGIDTTVAAGSCTMDCAGTSTTVPAASSRRSLVAGSSTLVAAVSVAWISAVDRNVERIDERVAVSGRLDHVVLRDRGRVSAVDRRRAVRQELHGGAVGERRGDAVQTSPSGSVTLMVDSALTTILPYGCVSAAGMSSPMSCSRLTA